ncbi:MAG: hypothetical protein E7167_03675 [Firmicutes bacterium]|nr:hypothetical protein [Bacillota bacterium]
MGKKKKGGINGAPLQSVTIGEIKKSKYGWIGTILLFCIFGGVIYYLPDITKLYQEYNGTSSTDNKVPGNNTTNNTVIDSGESDTDTEKTNQFLAFGTDTSFAIDKIEFRDIKMQNGILSFNAVTIGEISVSLNTLNLYIETYDKNTADANILNTIAIKGIVSPETPLNFSFNVKSGATHFNIKEILEDDYTYIDLTPDENNNIILTCKYEDETLVYTFVDDKLMTIENTVMVSKQDEKYNLKYQEYSSLVNRYGSTTGIKVSLSTNMYNLTYNIKIDYSSFNSQIENDYYFAKDVSPRVVNFKMESLLYECS